MFKDYKFWFIRRDDDGFITEAGVNFYEGKYEEILNPRTNELESVYVRKNKLKDVSFNKKPKKLNRRDGSESMRYTPEDFGEIKTDDELRQFLNKELDNVKGRESIPEQKWQS